MWKFEEHPQGRFGPDNPVPPVTIMTAYGKPPEKRGGPRFVDERMDVPSESSAAAPSDPAFTNPNDWYDSENQPVILVLALDPYNARLYHDMLEVRGYDAVIARGLDMWLETLSDCHPDLILIDLCSADHPSIDVAQAIMRDPRYKSIPRIAVTDSFESGDLSDPATIIVDCDGRIVKPVSVRDFYRPIETILKQSLTHR